jgi:putative transposase
MPKRTSRGRPPLANTSSDTSMQDIDSPKWSLARSQIADLKTVVREGALTHAQAVRLAARWGVSLRTVWRRARAYRAEPGVRSLLPRQVGAPGGVSRLGPDIEAVIRDVAKRWWAETENATIAEILPGVLSTCRARDLPAPSRASVARRLSGLRRDPELFPGAVASQLRERSRLVKRSYHVERALDVVQIDHTVADIFIVDPLTRTCIGRPTLTVAIDVATRCVPGLCLSLEAPSALAVALCLEHAVSPKGAWLEARGLDVPWPVHGIPRALHVDNGREFHSGAFRRGTDLNDIDVIYRPPGAPRFGGHIERLIGTLMRRVRLLPGNSYSDLLKQRPRRAEQGASLTLAELEAFLVEDLARYHTRTHRGIGMTPLTAWERQWARVPHGPRLPSDPARFRLDFLPLHRRVVGREGIEFLFLHYTCAALAPEVSPGVDRVIRVDPRTLAQVYLERDGQAPLVVPLRERQQPPMSLWEWNAVRRGRPELVPAVDAEAVGIAVRDLTPEACRGATALRARRRSARRAAWRAVEAVGALPPPQVILATTLASDAADALPWEVLE